MKIKTIITLTALFFSAAIQAAEPHVEQTIRDILENVRKLKTARPNAVAVAAFGNSYWTDGPFMRYVAVNRLPGGSKGVALMINGGEPPEEYKGLFRCVEQSKTMHRH